MYTISASIHQVPHQIPSLQSAGWCNCVQLCATVCAHTITITITTTITNTMTTTVAAAADCLLATSGL